MENKNEEIIDKLTQQQLIDSILNKSKIEHEALVEVAKKTIDDPKIDINKEKNRIKDEKLKEISDNASKEVIESSNEMIEDKDNDISGFLDVISFCSNSKIRNLTIILLIIELLGIALLTLKKLSFFLYYTFITLFTASLIAILTFLISFILSSEKDLKILVSLISKGYILALGFLILGIVFIIIHNIIKHYTNKEVVPF